MSIDALHLRTYDETASVFFSFVVIYMSITTGYSYKTRDLGTIYNTSFSALNRNVTNTIVTGYNDSGGDIGRYFTPYISGNKILCNYTYKGTDIGNFFQYDSITNINTSSNTKISSISSNINIYEFDSKGSISFNFDTPASILVVGGGGAGGRYGYHSNNAGGGGGGGGAVIYGTCTFTANLIYNINVGDGGKRTINVGGDGISSSIISIDNNSQAIAPGGGGGGCQDSGGGANVNGNFGGCSGGCGGGQYHTPNGVLPCTLSGIFNINRNCIGQGHIGGSTIGGNGAGGGGGANGDGYSNPNNHINGNPKGGDGGAGYQWPITNRYYGGGGAGGCERNNNDYIAYGGNKAGGDMGGTSGNTNGTSYYYDGTPNTGGGGAGMTQQFNNDYPGNGGSGIVIIAIDKKYS